MVKIINERDFGKFDLDYAYKTKKHEWQVIKWGNSVKRYHVAPEYFDTKKKAVEYCIEMIIDYSGALKVISPDDNEYYINATDFPGFYDGTYGEKELEKRIYKILVNEDN